MRSRFTGLFLALLLMPGLFSCSQPLTVEQQIIAVIREMEARIEAGERRPFMRHVADDFNGQNGRLGRDELRLLVIRQLNQYERLHAQLFPIHVSESGEKSAEASFRALITGGPGLIPESGQVYDFETHWLKQGDKWLLLRASWTPVALDEAIKYINE